MQCKGQGKWAEALDLLENFNLQCTHSDNFSFKFQALMTRFNEMTGPLDDVFTYLTTMSYFCVCPHIKIFSSTLN